MLDGGVDQVASRERRTSQITIGEIGRLKAAVTERCFLDVQFIKRTVIENAIVESEREVKDFAKIKTYSEHLAACENGLLERSVVRFYQTEIAVDEFAVDEPEMCEIAIGKIAIRKSTFFILTLLQRLIAKSRLAEFLICDEWSHIYLPMAGMSCTSIFLSAVCVFP